MVKLFFKGVYRLLQGIVWLTLWIYFRRIVFKNKEYLKSEGPLIIISNHPNTVMDPLVALYKVPAICHLLANYSLFKNPITNFLLTNLFCIPVQRVTDVAEGQPLQNDTAFQKAREHLISGGNLYIAIEGFSYPERKIRPFKTGTARIAFSTELQTNFELNLRILPIGITYFDGLLFRKDVYVEIGEPISVDSWREVYEKDPRKVIDTFTDYLENAMRPMAIDCKDAHEDNFLKKIEALLQAENPLNTEGVYQRSQTVLKNLRLWEASGKDTFEQFQDNVRAYFYKLNQLKINNLDSEKYHLSSFFKLLLSLPFSLIGFVINILPAWLSEKMIGWLHIDKSYDTTIRYVSGLIFFPLFWWLELILIRHYWQESPLLWLYIPMAILLGILAWWFYKESSRFLDYFRYKEADRNGNLSQMRQALLTQLMRLV